MDGLILCLLCLSDPLRALELQPFSLKPLLRRAMAYESLERYRKAYVDYKTVLQVDNGVQAAHDSVHRSAEESQALEAAVGVRVHSGSWRIMP